MLIIRDECFTFYTEHTPLTQCADGHSCTNSCYDDELQEFRNFRKSDCDDEKYHFNTRGFGEAEFVNYTGQKYVAVLKDNVVFAKNVETGVTRRMMNSRSSKIVSCQNTGMHDISVVYADGVVIVWNPLTDHMQQLL